MKELQKAESQNKVLQKELKDSENSKSSLSLDFKRLEQECMSLKSEIASEKEESVQSKLRGKAKEEQLERVTHELSKAQKEHTELLSLVAPSDSSFRGLIDKIKTLLARPEKVVEKANTTNPK